MESPNPRANETASTPTTNPSGPSGSSTPPSPPFPTRDKATVDRRNREADEMAQAACRAIEHFQNSPPPPMPSDKDTAARARTQEFGRRMAQAACEAIEHFQNNPPPPMPSDKAPPTKATTGRVFEDGEVGRAACRAIEHFQNSPPPPMPSDKATTDRRNREAQELGEAACRAIEHHQNTPSPPMPKDCHVDREDAMLEFLAMTPRREMFTMLSEWSVEALVAQVRSLASDDEGSDGMMPDSEGAAEGATIYGDRMDAADRLWTALDKQQQQKLDSVAEALGIDRPSTFL